MTAAIDKSLGYVVPFGCVRLKKLVKVGFDERPPRSTVRPLPCECGEVHHVEIIGRPRRPGEETWIDMASVPER